MLRQANRMEKALYGGINQFYVAFTDIYAQAVFAAKTCQVACLSFARAIVGVFPTCRMAHGQDTPKTRLAG